MSMEIWAFLVRALLILQEELAVFRSTVRASHCSFIYLKLITGHYCQSCFLRLWVRYV